MISHTQKPGVRHQNQVSSITTSKVRKLHPEGFGNGPNWFPIPKNMGIDTKIKSLASPQAKLEIYTLKGSWTSYRPSTLFLTFRLIWGSRPWSQLIPHTQKHVDRHQNQVSSISTSKVRNLHPEGVLDLLQPLHPILGLQVNLGVLKIVPNDSPYPKTWG